MPHPVYSALQFSNLCDYCHSILAQFINLWFCQPFELPKLFVLGEFI